MSNLTAATTKTAGPGKHGDGNGNGLILNVTRTGTRSWVQRITIDGKRRDIGLGPYPAVTLAAARRQALQNRALVANGGDPTSKQQTKQIPTFREAAAQLLALKRGGVSLKTANDWYRNLQIHAAPIWAKKLHRINAGDVLGCLEPLWVTKPVAAKRARAGIRSVLYWGVAHGHIQQNPAGPAINRALPKQPATTHRAAVPYTQIRKVLAAIREHTQNTTARCCLEYIINTAARSVEATQATWDEIDLEHAAWAIPAHRTKQRREHKIPLNSQAMAVLAEAAKLRTSDSNYVFGSTTVTNKPIDSTTLLRALRTAGVDATVHGFRSTFRTWALEQTSTPWAVAEAALAHHVGDSTERAYARSDLFQKRRTLMTQWGTYLETGKNPSNET